MSARDQILSDVRRALQNADRTSPDVPRGYRASAKPDVELFVERVADYRAVVERCAPDEVETRIESVLAGRAAVVPKGLPWAIEGAIGDELLEASELDRIDAVITAASVGIAETGTIVLDHGVDQGRRVVSLVPDLHVCVVRADQIVDGVPDAVALLDPLRPQTWISGPSATSDIELQRVEGVHGPRQLHVIVVDAPEL